MSRLYEKYKNTIREELKKELNLGNIMMVPKLEKIVINSGVGGDTVKGGFKRLERDVLKYKPDQFIP